MKSKYSTSPDETADKSAADKAAGGVENTWAEKSSPDSSQSKSDENKAADEKNKQDAQTLARNQSGSASAYATNETTTPDKQAEERLKLEKSEPPATLKPADRREEQAIRNMTPLDASNSIAPSGKDEQGKLTFSNKGDRVAHTLERCRQLLLERNAHLGQSQLMADIDAALAEYKGEETPAPLGSFAPSSTGQSSKAESSSQSSPSTQSEGRDLAVP